MDDEKLPLGAWEGDRDKLKNVPLGDRGDSSGLPELLQFRLHLVRLILKRERNLSAEYDYPAAFVLVDPAEFQRLKASGAFTEVRLIHTGARRLTGLVHIMTFGATSSLTIEALGDSELFNVLESAEHRGKPTFIYVPQKPISTLSFYARGCEVDECSDVPLHVSSISADQIKKAIDSVYEQELVTPDGAGPLKIWSDPAKGRPTALAERSIQQIVRIGLVAKFSPCSIRAEQSGKVGRTDLEIVEVKPSGAGELVHHALLELKVLRSWTESGSAVTGQFVRDHIDEGVKQANAYGKEKNSKIKMLSCFDMRDSDLGDSATFAHVAALADTLGVLTSRWFLYASSKAYREAIAASDTGASA